MRKIRSGDTVLVTSGRNKGQQGKVRINLIEKDRIVVEGLNIVTKHIKRGRARQAGLVKVEAPFHVSNVMLVCPTCKEPTRVGVRTGEDGKNARFCKKCDAWIPRPNVD